MPWPSHPITRPSSLNWIRAKVGPCPESSTGEGDRNCADNKHLVRVVVLEDDACRLARLMSCCATQIDHNPDAIESCSGSKHLKGLAKFEARIANFNRDAASGLRGPIRRRGRRQRVLDSNFKLPNALLWITL